MMYLSLKAPQNTAAGQATDGCAMHDLAALANTGCTSTDHAGSAAHGVHYVMYPSLKYLCHAAAEWPRSA